MKNKSIFERFLNEYHQKLVKVFTLKQLQQLLGIIGLSTAAIFIVARFIVIVEWKALILVASILACAFIGYKVFKVSPTKRTTMKAYNDYIENDYIVTTYELDKNHPQYQAIRNKTEQLMEQKHAEILAIKQPILDKKWATVFVVCLFVSFLSYYLPSETQKTAIQQQEVNELIKETEDDLEQLKQLTNNEEKKELIELSQEQLAELQNVEEIIQQIEKLNAEMNLKLLKEFENMTLLQQVLNSSNSNLNSLKEALKNKNLNELKEQLASLDTSALSSDQQSMLEKVKQLQLTEEQLKDLLENKSDEQLSKQLNEIGKQVERTAKEIDPSLAAQFQGTIAQAPTNQNSNQLSQQNTNGSNNGTTNPSSSSNGGQMNPSTNGSGSSPSNGSNAGTGSSASGSSNSGSSGSASGSQGSSSGQMGAGIGAGQGSRDLTLPSRIVGEHSIEMDAGELGNGQQGTIVEAEGLAVKGQIQDYEKVVNAYESVNENTVNRTPLPSNLAELVKQYFSNME